MIYGKRLRFRDPERADIHYFVRWLNGPEVGAGLMLYLSSSIGEEEHWFEKILKRPAPEHLLVIQIKEDENWRAAGNCGFHDIDWWVRGAEVGIFIGEKSYCSKGYGTEVMGVLLQHGFETLNLNRIMLRVYENN